jgi:hypothetical protein
MRFTQEVTRDIFTSMVLYEMRLVDRVFAIAERINQHMQNRTEGRSWMAAHMRRTDCSYYI